MRERTGNGDIDIKITIYPNTPPEKGSRYERAITRQISVGNLESLAEMSRVAYNLAEMATGTIAAMLNTLIEREEAEAKAEAEALGKLYTEGVVVVEELPE